MNRMCQKTRVFKQFHAVMITFAPSNVPITLQVFKQRPSVEQINYTVQKYAMNYRPMPVSFIYSEKPQIHVVPIHISPDIMLN